MKLSVDLGRKPTQTVELGNLPVSGILGRSPLKWYSFRVGGDAGYLKITVTREGEGATVRFEAKLYGKVYYGFNTVLPQYTSIKQDYETLSIPSPKVDLTILYLTRYYSIEVNSKQIYRTWDVCYTYESIYECELEYDDEVNSILNSLRSPREILMLESVFPDKLLKTNRNVIQRALQRNHIITKDRWNVTKINNSGVRKTLDRPVNTPQASSFDAEVVRAYLVNELVRQSNISVVFTELYRVTKDVNFVVQFWFHRTDGYDELVFSFQDSDGTKRLLVEVWEVDNGVHKHQYDLFNTRLAADTEAFLVMLSNRTSYIVIDGEVKKFSDFVAREYEYETFGYEIQIVARPGKVVGTYQVCFPQWPSEIYLTGDVVLKYSDAQNSARQVGYKNCQVKMFEPNQIVTKSDLLVKQYTTPVVVGDAESTTNTTTPPIQEPVSDVSAPTVEKPLIEKPLDLDEIETQCVAELMKLYNKSVESMTDYILASAVLWGTSVEAMHNKHAKTLVRVNNEKMLVDHAVLTSTFFKKDTSRNLLREFCRRRCGYVARKIQKNEFDVNLQLVSKYMLLKEFAHLAFDFLNMKFFPTATQDELAESNKVTNFKYIRVSKILNYDRY
nr:minor coat protein [Agapanthus velarivirus]